MNNNITCIGDWCKKDGNNNGFDCMDMGVECYYIIDMKNTPYDKCNTNNLGNVIMASGSWNNQISQKHWNNVISEKLKVYGKKIFCQALKNVIECDSNCVIDLPVKCYDYTWFQNLFVIVY